MNNRVGLVVHIKATIAISNFQVDNNVCKGDSMFFIGIPLTST